MFTTTDHLDSIGPLDTFTPADCKAANLRPGMILVDPDLHTAEAVIDHRMRGGRDGAGRWLVHDLNAGTFTEVELHLNALLTVAGSPEPA